MEKKTPLILVKFIFTELQGVHEELLEASNDWAKVWSAAMEEMKIVGLFRGGGYGMEMRLGLSALLCW